MPIRTGQTENCLITNKTTERNLFFFFRQTKLSKAVTEKRSSCFKFRLFRDTMETVKVLILQASLEFFFFFFFSNSSFFLFQWVHFSPNKDVCPTAYLLSNLKLQREEQMRNLWILFLTRWIASAFKWISTNRVRDVKQIWRTPSIDHT